MVIFYYYNSTIDYITDFLCVLWRMKNLAHHRSWPIVSARIPTSRRFYDSFD